MNYMEVKKKNEKNILAIKSYLYSLPYGAPIKNSFYNRKYLAYNYYPKYKPIDAVLNSNLYL